MAPHTTQSHSCWWNDELTWLNWRSSRGLDLHSDCCCCCCSAAIRMCLRHKSACDSQSIQPDSFTVNTVNTLRDWSHARTSRLVPSFWANVRVSVAVALARCIFSPHVRVYRPAAFSRCSSHAVHLKLLTSDWQLADCFHGVWRTFSRPMVSFLCIVLFTVCCFTPTAERTLKVELLSLTE